MKRELWPIDGNLPPGHITLVLGAEHDDQLFRALKSILKSLGARRTGRNYLSGGSQDIFIHEFKLKGKTIQVEAETYIGLSISGEKALVEKIERRTRAALGRSRKLTWPDPKMIKLGEPKDPRIVALVHRVFAELGAKTLKTKKPPGWKFGVEAWEFERNGRILRIVNDPGYGLTLTADADIVDALAQRIRDEAQKARAKPA